MTKQQHDDEKAKIHSHYQEVKQQMLQQFDEDKVYSRLLVSRCSCMISYSNYSALSVIWLKQNKLLLSITK